MWFLLLLVLCATLYLNQVGLPGFLKRPLLEKLRARGVDLQFSRLRLRFYQGLVADNVSFGQSNDPLSPRLTAAEVSLGVNVRELLRRQLQIDSITLRQGRLVLPLAQTNAGPRELTIEHIHARLSLLPPDNWALNDLNASFAGADFELSGALAHASAARQWKFLSGQPAGQPETQARLREAADLIEQVHFETPPSFHLQVNGDARDLRTLNLRLDVIAPAADTPWGDLQRGRLKLRLLPASGSRTPTAEFSVSADSARTSLAEVSNLRLDIHASSFEGLAHLANAELTSTGAPPGVVAGLRGLSLISDAQVQLRAQAARTRWSAITNLHLNLALATAERTNAVRASFSGLAESVETQWVRATNASFSVQWLHDLTNALPSSGMARLDCEDARGEWGQARKLAVRLSGARGEMSGTDQALSASLPAGWWTNLTPFQIEFGARLDDVRSPRLEARAVSCAGQWNSPLLAVTNIAAQFDPGSVQASAELDATRRQFRFQLASDADPHAFEAFLSESARQLLEQLSLSKPPSLRGEGELTLPPWTNQEPGWARQVQPTLRLAGEFAVDSAGAFHGIAFQQAQSHFSYSNMTWVLPDVRVRLSEGTIEARHQANERTGQIYWQAHSTMDPQRVRPLLDADTAAGLDLFVFTKPPVVDVEFWACSNDVARLGLKGHLFATNFTFRGETVASVDTALNYTNGWLLFTHPHLSRPGNEQMSADSLNVEFSTQRIYLTNGFSTADPGAVTRAIGPNVARAMQPYHFARPPTVQAQGIIPLRGEEDADLHFKVLGGPFEWWHFQLPEVAGNIHWFGEHVELEDVRSVFYGGKASGQARFDFRPGADTQFSFALDAVDANLQPLVTAISGHPSKLEGRLTGNLVITSASTEDWRKTQGRGGLDLRDGLIWDTPVFGIFSEVLNGIVPGLGYSRANSAICTFLITNGVIHSSDLEIRSPTLRLEYRGNVDLDGNLNARVEAEFLRNMWLVGPLVSTMFWPVTKVFEYKVTGTLDKPKAEPLYLLSRILMFPLHPLQTLKDLAPKSSNSKTNEPPPAPPATK